MLVLRTYITECSVHMEVFTEGCIASTLNAQCLSKECEGFVCELSLSILPASSFLPLLSPPLWQGASECTTIVSKLPFVISQTKNTERKGGQGKGGRRDAILLRLGYTIVCRVCPPAAAMAKRDMFFLSTTTRPSFLESLGLSSPH